MKNKTYQELIREKNTLNARLKELPLCLVPAMYEYSQETHIRIQEIENEIKAISDNCPHCQSENRTAHDCGISFCHDCGEFDR